MILRMEISIHYSHSVIKKVLKTRYTNLIDNLKVLSRVAIMRLRGEVRTLLADTLPSLDQIIKTYAKKARALALASTGLPNVKRSLTCMLQ